MLFSSSYEPSFHLPHEKRVFESSRIREKFPSRVPILAYNRKGFYKKYLAGKETSWSLFLQRLRKDLELLPEEGIYAFLICNSKSTLESSSKTVEEIDYRYVSKDGFLHVYVDQENTFG